MAVKIRPITLKDAANFRLCLDTVAKERRHIYDYEAPPLPKIRQRLRKRLREKIPHIVAVDGMRVVGWAGVYRPGVPSIWHCGDLSIGLLPEYRGLGLGTKLATRVLKMARGKYEFVIAAVVRKNKPARKLFKKMGFQLCGTQK